MAATTRPAEPPPVATSCAGVGAVLGAAVILGTGPVAAEALPRSAPALAIAALRAAVGAAVLGAAVGRPALAAAWSQVDRRRLAVAGIGVAGFQVAVFAAVARTGAGVSAAVATAATPVAAGLATGRATRPRWWAGLAAVLAGVLALAHAAGGSATPSGVALAAVAGCAYAAYAVASPGLVAAAGPTPAAALVLVVAAGLLSPALLATGRVIAGPADLAVVAWLGVAATAAAYVLLARGLRTVVASRATALLLAQPVATAVLAAAVLGEPLTAATVAALALVGVGGSLVS